MISQERINQFQSFWAHFGILVIHKHQLILVIFTFYQGHYNCEHFQASNHFNPLPAEFLENGLQYNWRLPGPVGKGLSEISQDLTDFIYFGREVPILVMPPPVNLVDHLAFFLKHCLV